MKIGLVGCGQIARVHAGVIHKLRDHRLVGVCDADRGRAAGFADAYGAAAYSSLEELLAEERPDVVHIVTPPQSHAPLAIRAMEAGCHVLVEKPMALNEQDADAMIAATARCGRKLCVDHNQLFDPVMLEARELVRRGVAGRVIDVQSYYGFNLAQTSERRWVETLPGGVFQNLMPHPLYLLLEFVGEPLDLQVSTLDTGGLGPHGPDELRVLVRGSHALGSLAISLAIRPHLNFLRLAGSQAIVHADLANMILSVERLRPLPKPVARGLLNVEHGVQLAGGAVRNAARLLLGRLTPYQGVGTLIRAFYDSIERNQPSPVPGEAGRRVVQVFQRIQAQLPAPRAPLRTSSAPAVRDPRVLVTGATGFVGRHLVEKLLARGAAVRALVRPTSRVGQLGARDIDWVEADLGDVETLKRAMDGVDVVYHCAAATQGAWPDYLEGTIRGTERLLAAAASVGVRRLVHVSSLSVYAAAELRSGATVTEDSPLEPYPERRGHYAHSKVEAEKLVRTYAKERDLPVTVLRPGTIYGPGGKVFFPRIGVNVKNRLIVIFGDGRSLLPLAYVENVADAICLAGAQPQALGQTYNIVDSEPITQREYVAAMVRALGLRAAVLRVPFGALHLAAGILDQRVRLRSPQGSPGTARYRLAANSRALCYDSTRAAVELGWRPAVPLAEGLRRTFDWYRSRGRPAPLPPAAASAQAATPAFSAFDRAA